MLVSSHAKHRLTVDVWGTMSAAQREKASSSRACFTLPAPPSSTSTDDLMTVPLTPGVGKKPHQCKRSRPEPWCVIEESMAEHTTTVSAKKPRPGFSSSTADVINDQSDDDVA